VENLFEDIKDGVYLLSLLEVLSGEKLVSWLNVELKFVLKSYGNIYILTECDNYHRFWF
jgi:hypothetical protein